MLTSLQIRDLAIIEQVTLELSRGLTVLTGETGAGKSIVVDALQLLAGGRAGAEVVRHGAERAEVAGTFDLSLAAPALTAWLAEQSLEVEGELIIRRVVGSDGRSRAYLNGQTVPLALLREAGELLIDIHGQHEFQSLTRERAQRELLDAYARHAPKVAAVADAHRAWQGLLSQAQSLEAAARDRQARLELLSYQVQELKALELREGEVEALTEERIRLSHSGKLAEGAQLALSLLYETEGASASVAISRAAAALRPLAGLDPALAPALALIEEATIQVREAARALARYGEGLDMDPARQDEVERRLAAIEELGRKHRVAATELSARTTQLAAELEALTRADTDLASLRQQARQALTRCRELAQALSGSRAKAARAMAADITARMQTLGMAGGCFEVQLEQRPPDEPAEHGLDQVELQVSANPGQPPRPLAKVASGGELARLSLAVQVATRAQETRCMVFDEVDSGIGGGVAEIVGKELRALGTRGQVLCVTHLPQVAAQGHQHLRVAKLTDAETTRTQLSPLTPTERVEEVARMLGGLTITQKAREHAREMLAAAGKGNPGHEDRRRRSAAKG
jgi:DNA repair protein RecN (Recombination protein N)